MCRTGIIRPTDDRFEHFLGCDSYLACAAIRVRFHFSYVEGDANAGTFTGYLGDLLRHRRIPE